MLVSAARRSWSTKPRRLFDAVVWRQFSDVHTDLWTYFEQTTERLIREAIHTDTTDARSRSRADRAAVGARFQAANCD